MKKEKLNPQIKKIKAKEILDSRRNPTLEVELITTKGLFRAAVPSGASKGKYEAVELRDGGKRYNGKGVLKAVKNVNKIIAPKLKGKNPLYQKEIDNLIIKLDGTKNKSKLGANAILGVSMAVCRAGAAEKNIPLYTYISKLFNSNKKILPVPCFNVINGGAHARNELDFQEFMLVPQAKKFFENLKISLEIYQELKKVIKKKYGKGAINIGDEGGFTPQIKRPEEALDLILKAAENLGYKNKIKIILDVASSEFFTGKEYKTHIGKLSPEKMLNYYLALIEKYPIIGIEDGFSQDEWDSWKELKFATKKKNTLIIGDDLTATNQKRVRRAIKKDAINAIIIKLNQIGTVTEAIDCTKFAQKSGCKIIVSHRSGETFDNFISDFSVGVGADYIKTGMPVQKERKTKYDRLIKIEKELK